MTEQITPADTGESTAQASPRPLLTARSKAVLVTVQSLVGVVGTTYGLIQPNTDNKLLALAVVLVAVLVGAPLIVLAVGYLDRRRHGARRRGRIGLVLGAVALATVATLLGGLLGRKLVFGRVSDIVTIDRPADDYVLPAAGADHRVSVWFTYTIHDTGNDLCAGRHLWFVERSPSRSDERELYAAREELRCVEGTASFTEQIEKFAHHEFSVISVSEADHRTWALVNHHYFQTGDRTADGHWIRLPPSYRLLSKTIHAYQRA